jgi:monoamine oxidase
MMQKSRRDFLKTLAAGSALAPLAGGAASGLLSGCASLDRWVMGDTRDEGDKVLIIGAGLAGLAAAYHLKKNQVPFRMYEGAARMGGRVWTLSDLNISSEHGELGAERIESEHTQIQNLAQELKIRLLEVNPKESIAWLEKGKILTAREWRKEGVELVKLFQQVQNEAYGPGAQILSLQNQDQFPKAVLLDRMSAGELLERLSIQMQPWMKTFLTQIIRAEWGVEPHEISSLHLLHWMRDSFQISGKKYFKVAGGTSNLTQALFDRVGGVIPERFVQFQHRLMEVRPLEGGGWSLFFNTPDGRSEIKGRRVICTLPPTMLRQVTGWESIPMSSSRRETMAQQSLGSQGKVLMSFQDRFWGDSSILGNGGSLYTDQVVSLLSEAGDPAVSGLNSLHGVLQAVVGGQAGEGAGLHLVPQILKELEKVAVRPVSYENISYVQNWKKHPWSKGSRSYLKPGQFQNYDIAAGMDSGVPFAWQFAGESQSLVWMGTMNGAVQTGIEAAARFLKTSS